MDIKMKIINFVNKTKYIPSTGEDIANSLKIKKNEYKIFKKVLEDMEKENNIYKDKNGYYITLKNALKGKIEVTKRGFGFFLVEDGEDIFISKYNLNTAHNGDTVLLAILDNDKENYGRSQEGNIIKIIERANKKIVGRFESTGKVGFVIPDDEKIDFDVYIPKGNKNGAKDGDKVVVKVNYNTRGKNPEGVIIEILGNEHEDGINLLSILKRYDVETKFSDKVYENMEKLEDEITKKDIEGRKDYRNLFTVTIDGEDAKDFDDAISIEKIEDKFKLYVHIADVSHYVRYKTPLDYEAERRANSIYLMNSVIPMLPEKLSNNLCSLMPGKDRLSISLEMIIDKKGKVIEEKIYSGIINSNHRLIYDDVSNFLENGDSQNYSEEIKEKLLEMQELFKIIKQRRINRGSIDFNFEEAQFIFDKKGKIIDVKKFNRRIANMIIEEFMIISNETIASKFAYMNIPFMFRSHENPEKDKIKELNERIAPFGYKVNNQNFTPKDFQELIEEIKGKDEEDIISKLILRSMKKAKYSTKDSYHFGLASMFYTHFTAPIRRYSDIIVHRAIKKYIKNDIVSLQNKSYIKRLEKNAKHISEIEIKTEEIERDVSDMLKAEYMNQFLGEEFIGKISTIISFGVFVELENTVEGFVSFNDIKDEYFLFDEKNYIAKSETGNKILKVGDHIKVRVASVDVLRGKIDFYPLENDK